jgi:hypothetical protein
MYVADNDDVIKHSHVHERKCIAQAPRDDLVRLTWL